MRDASDPPAPTPTPEAGHAALRELLADGFAELGRVPDGRSVERLAQLAGLLEEWGAAINLTGHRTAEAIARRLILDAVALWFALAERTPVRSALARTPAIVDLGSGAGFPGIPFAVLAPEFPVLLVDARERRHHFQRAARRLLELPNLDCQLGRIEQLPARPAGLVIAQALAKPAKVLELGLRWAAPAGVLVIPGGAEAPEPGPHTAIGASGSGHYAVPLGGPRRSFWWGALA